MTENLLSTLENKSCFMNKTRLAQYIFDIYIPFYTLKQPCKDDYIGPLAADNYSIHLIMLL